MHNLACCIVVGPHTPTSIPTPIPTPFLSYFFLLLNYIIICFGQVYTTSSVCFSHLINAAYSTLPVKGEATDVAQVTQQFVPFLSFSLSWLSPVLGHKICELLKDF